MEASEHLYKTMGQRAARAAITAYSILSFAIILIVGGIYILVEAQDFVKNESEAFVSKSDLDEEGDLLLLAIKQLRVNVQKEIRSSFKTPSTRLASMLSHYHNPTIGYISDCPEQFWFANIITDGVNVDYSTVAAFPPTDKNLSVCFRVVLDLSSVPINEKDRRPFLNTLSVYLGSLGEREDYVQSFKLTFEKKERIPGVSMDKNGVVEISESATETEFKKLVNIVLGATYRGNQVKDSFSNAINKYKAFHSYWRKSLDSQKGGAKAGVSENTETRKFYLIQVSVLRAGIVLLLIFLVSIIVPLYRYNIQLSVYYWGVADLVGLSKPEQEPWPFKEASEVLIPRFGLGKEPATPIDSIVNLVNRKN